MPPPESRPFRTAAPHGIAAAALTRPTRPDAPGVGIRPPRLVATEPNARPPPTLSGAGAGRFPSAAGATPATPARPAPDAAPFHLDPLAPAFHDRRTRRVAPMSRETTDPVVRAAAFEWLRQRTAERGRPIFEFRDWNAASGSAARE